MKKGHSKNKRRWISLLLALTISLGHMLPTAHAVSPPVLAVTSVGNSSSDVYNVRNLNEFRTALSNYVGSRSDITINLTNDITVNTTLSIDGENLLAFPSAKRSYGSKLTITSSNGSSLITRAGNHDTATLTIAHKSNVVLTNLNIRSDYTSSLAIFEVNDGTTLTVSDGVTIDSKVTRVMSNETNFSIVVKSGGTLNVYGGDVNSVKVNRPISSSARDAIITFGGAATVAEYYLSTHATLKLGTGDNSPKPEMLIGLVGSGLVISNVEHSALEHFFIKEQYYELEYNERDREILSIHNPPPRPKPEPVEPEEPEEEREPNDLNEKAILNAVADFGMNVNDYKLDTTSHPLEEFIPQRGAMGLYLADMNNPGDWEGKSKILAPINHNPSEETLKIAGGHDNIKSAMGPGLLFDNSWEYKYADNSAASSTSKFHPYFSNSVAVDFNNDGIDEIFEVRYYKGTSYVSSNKWGESTSEYRILFTVYQRVGLKYKVVYQTTHSAESWISSVSADKSRGLTALAAGSFISSYTNQQQVAVYIPSKTAPEIRIYRPEFTKNANGVNTVNGFVVADTIHLDDYKGLNSSWDLPMVQLESANMRDTRVDELIINISMPLTSSYKNHDQSTYLLVYREYSQRFKSALSASSTERLRFSAAQKYKPLNSNDDRDLVFVAGWSNTYDSKDSVGKLQEKYLYSTLYYDAGSSEYKLTGFNSISSLKSLKRDNSMIPPIALAVGSMVDTELHVFLNGVLCKATFSKNGNVPSLTLSRALDITLSKTNYAYVDRAYFIPFQNNNTRLNQLVYTTTSRSSSLGMGIADDLSDYHIGWIWLEDVRIDPTTKATNYIIKGGKSTNSFYFSGGDNEFGSSFVLFPIRGMNNNINYKYTGNAYAWSEPIIDTIMTSVPYYSDVDYGGSPGSTTVSITNSDSTSEGKQWKAGASLFLGGSATFGAKFLGQEGKVGGGFDLEFMFDWSKSRVETDTKSTSINFSAAPGETNLLVKAAPTIMYTYSVDFPEILVTKELYDQMKKSEEVIDEVTESHTSIDDLIIKDSSLGGDIIGYIPAGVEDIQYSLLYPPLFSIVSLDEYNALAKQHKMTPLDIEAVYAHKPGSPETYPKDTVDLRTMNDENGDDTLMSSTQMSVRPSSNSFGFGFGTDHSKSIDQSYSFGGSISAFGSMSGEAGVILKVGLEGHLGGRVRGGGGWSTGTTEASSNAFSSSISNLPTSIDNNNYNYSVQMHYWQNQGNERMGIPEGVKVIGFTTDGNGWVNLPANLPRNFRVDHTTNSDASLAWDIPTDTKAEFYKIFEKPHNRADFTELPDRINPTDGHFLIRNLDAGSMFDYAIRAVRTAANGLAINSTLGSPITIQTKGKTGPHIIKPPNHSYVKEGETARFEVTAVKEEGKTGDLIYQWQAYIRGGNNVIGSWENIANATAPELVIGNVTPDMNGDLFRVIVSQQGNTNPADYSRAVNLWVNDTYNPEQPNISLTITDTNGQQIEHINGDEFVVNGDITLKANVRDSRNNTLTNKDGAAVFVVFGLNDGIIAPFFTGELEYNPQTAHFESILYHRDIDQRAIVHIVAFFSSYEPTGPQSGFLSAQDIREIIEGFIANAAEKEEEQEQEAVIIIVEDENEAENEGDIENDISDDDYGDDEYEDYGDVESLPLLYSSNSSDPGYYEVRLLEFLHSKNVFPSNPLIIITDRAHASTAPNTVAEVNPKTGVHSFSIITIIGTFSVAFGSLMMIVKRRKNKI
ncbi:MAG: hypothetical protein FWH05_03720 [Oscillospiraceae bacterium]|nr:hypothetical protein [Oscillospiraceae bacterium]